MGGAASAPIRKILWADTVPSEKARPSLAGERRTSVAIVGAGITGLSTALHLRQHGIDCLVVEAGRVGHGASGRNNGQVIPGLKTDSVGARRQFGAAADMVMKAAESAADLVFGLIERHGIDCAPRRGGWVRAAHAPAAMRALEAAARDRWAWGASLELLDTAAVHALTGTTAYVGGMIDRRAGSIQPLAYTRGLARAAERLGAAIFEDSPVSAVRRGAAGWSLETPQGSAVAEAVLLATGAYSDDLWPGLESSFFAVQSVQLATEPLSDESRGELLASGAVLSDTRKLAYAVRLDPEGRFVIAGRGPLDGSTGPQVERGLARAAERLYPRLRGARWTHLWSGRIAVTLDQVPHVVRLAPGVLAVVGYNGRGVAMGTAMGALLADRLAGRAGECEGYPERSLASVPLHRLRLPIMAGAVAYYRLRDSLGLASR